MTSQPPSPIGNQKSKIKNESIRAFIAFQVEPAPRLCRVLAELRCMGKAVRVVRPDALHSTLRFLGDIDEGDVPAIAAAMEHAVDGVEPMQFVIRGVGAFPFPSRPRVVWAAMQGVEPLGPVVSRLEQELEYLDVRPEQRPWRPHLTLARLRARPPKALHELIERHHETEFAVQTVADVRLVRSELLPVGPRYSVLASTFLKVR